nr:chromosome partitioning protein ParB [Desulfuromonadales bacterium]
RSKSAKARPAEIIALETRLGDHLGADVKIEYKGKGGRVLLRFNSLAELERIYRSMLGD